MAQQITAPKYARFQHLGKLVAVGASTGAALVSIVTALYSYGVLGKSESHQTIGNLGAAWVKLRPFADTASSIGDTMHYVATVADKNGSVLIGATPVWTTGDSNVATATGDGAVIARGPGLTTVAVIVGQLVSRSQILVKQRVAGVVVSSDAGDTALTIPEGGSIQLRARPVDARGHTVPRVAGGKWQVDNASVAEIDDNGVLTGKNSGRTVVSTSVDGATGYLPVAVMITASALSTVAGGGQHALAGKTLPQRIVVRATSRRGVPTPGKTVTFRLSDDQGSLDPAMAITDADGRARTTWTLGGDPGHQTLLATVENVDSALAIEAEADPVAKNTKVSAIAEQLRARAGEMLADSVGVRITDSTGRVLPDVPVRWSVMDGGSIQAISARTDSLGIARARWTLADKTGTQRARAIVARDIPPVTISASAIAGEPVAMAILTGDGQRGNAGSPLPKPIVIRVVDAKGNGAADVSVTLAPSGGAVPDTTMRTDSTGVAKVQWTIGRNAGDYTLIAQVSGIKKTLKVSARAAHAKAANLAFDDAPIPGEKPRANARRVMATVTDVYGNPVPDAPVNFAVKSGAVTPARAVTDAKGRVTLRWLLGAKQGEQTLRGSVRNTDVGGTYVTQVGAPVPVRQAGTQKPKQR